MSVSVMRKAYIICAADIIPEGYITRYASNGHQCKKASSVLVTKEALFGTRNGNRPLASGAVASSDVPPAHHSLLALRFPFLSKKTKQGGESHLALFGTRNGNRTHNYPLGVENIPF
ncbi:MAG: hypothetical protein E7595_07575 [Ruminococcaceae bacterium]|nr:hypothetical protein [Oscillospiraceae bacterium]